MQATRRAFLKGTLYTAGAFNLVPSRVLGGPDAPGGKVVMGMIGLGGMGTQNLRTFLGLSDVAVRAVCDVNTVKMTAAKKIVDDHYHNTDCLMVKDYRDLCSRPDIDAVSIATPDHWHAAIGIFAARHGKDIYGEKPFTYSLREGRALVNAVRDFGVVWQTGSWQRSSSEMERAVELVRNGRIGRIANVVVGLPGGGQGDDARAGAPVPPGLDWDFWLGPAPYRPFAGIYDWYWRWVLDWGGGQLMDWIGHHVDIAQWGMQSDSTGPVKVVGYAPYTTRGGIYDSPERYSFTCTYDNGVTLTVADDSQVRAGVTWYGENGDWVWVDRGGYEASRVSIRESKIEAGEQRFTSPGHHRNFIDCVRNRDLAIAPAESAHRAASIGHLGQVAMFTGRALAWDSVREVILNDPAANALLGRVSRTRYLG